VERGRRVARDGVIGGNGAALLDYLLSRVEAGDAVKSRAAEVPLRGGDVVVE